MNTVAGITIDRTSSGKPFYAHIDLRKHPFFISVLEENGFEIKPEIKWTAKMKRALSETEFKKGDINNFWDE